MGALVNAVAPLTVIDRQASWFTEAPPSLLRG